MRTTLKRGIGRGAGLNGTNGHAVFPPGTVSSVVRYRQPPPPADTGLGLLGRILLGTLLTVLALGLAVVGGALLWFHESVAQVRAHSTDVKIAQKQLDVTLPDLGPSALVRRMKSVPVSSTAAARSSVVFPSRSTSSPTSRTCSWATRCRWICPWCSRSPGCGRSEAR